MLFKFSSVCTFVSTTIQDDCKRRTLFLVFRGFEGIYFFFCQARRSWGGGGRRGSHEPPLQVNDGGLKPLKVCFPYIVIHTS